jgi:N-acylneuraminate cytidylyltransferase
MNTCCIIPARGGSKGIPKKNITPIYGKPLIAWTILAAKKSKYLKDKIYVSSDDEEILEIGKRYGAKGILRPNQIAGDSSPSEEALAHAVEKTECSPDFTVFLQPTSPLRSPKDIDLAIETFTAGRYDSLFSGSDAQDCCIWREHDWISGSDRLVSVTYDYHHRKMRQDFERLYLENGSIYIFKNSLLSKNNNRLGGKIGVYIMEGWKSHEIDDLDDLDLCEFYLKKRTKELGIIDPLARAPYPAHE